MRTLLYKRTHHGDPDRAGRFGIHDCMGQVRALAFDAVIGIGGIGPEPQAAKISELVNWIGIEPRKREFGLRGPLVTFRRFHLFTDDTIANFWDDAPNFWDVAPVLTKRMYSEHAPRFLFDSFNTAEQAEINRLLKLLDTVATTRTKQSSPRVRPNVCRTLRC